MSVRFSPFRPMRLIRSRPHNTITDTLFNGAVGNSLAILATGISDAARAAVTARNREAAGGHFRALHSGTGAVVWEVTDAGASGLTTVPDGSITSAKIADGTLVDGDINAAAAILGSKLADASIPSSKLITGAAITPGSITNTEISPSAAIAGSKLAAHGVTQTRQTSTGTTFGHSGAAGTWVYTGFTLPLTGLTVGSEVLVLLSGSIQVSPAATANMGLGVDSPSAPNFTSFFSAAAGAYVAYTVVGVFTVTSATQQLYEMVNYSAGATITRGTVALYAIELKR